MKTFMWRIDEELCNYLTINRAYFQFENVSSASSLATDSNTVCSNILITITLSNMTFHQNQHGCPLSEATKNVCSETNSPSALADIRLHSDQELTFIYISLPVPNHTMLLVWNRTEKKDVVVCFDGALRVAPEAMRGPWNKSSPALDTTLGARFPTLHGHDSTSHGRQRWRLTRDRTARRGRITRRVPPPRLLASSPGRLGWEARCAECRSAEESRSSSAAYRR